MNTPPPLFDLPQLDARELDNKLRQVTPEIDFPSETAHSNKWSAELAAHGLEAAAVYDERHTISDKEYWQVEALTLMEVYLQQSQMDKPEAERWRNACIGIEALLKNKGIEIEKQRRFIDDENYWKLEADRLKLYTARLENELLDRFLANTTANGQKLLSPVPETERRHQRQCTRPQYRSCKTEKRHGMTLRSATAGVVKRRNKVGGKTRQS